MNLDYTKSSKCVNDSFNGEDPTTAADNKYLKEDYVYKMKSGVRFLPELMIN